MDPVRVTFLGSGDAFSSQGRNQASCLVQSPSATFLLDCGATALCSLKRRGFDPGSINAILLSHLHGDHFAGLPFLFLEFIYLRPRTRMLRIAGPPGTEERVWELHCAMYGGAPDRAALGPAEFCELLPGRSQRLDALTVHPFRVPHQEDEISLGLTVEVDGRRICYSGDSGWTEDLIRQSQGTDLFICECSFFETRMQSHLDFTRILQNRHRFGTKRLILTHLGSEVLSKTDPLEIELAHDGLQVEI